MNKTQEARLDYLNTWPETNYLHNEAYLDKVRTNPIFSSMKVFVFHPDKEYNIILSYFMESLSFLKERPDLSFDCLWRAFEKAIKLEGENPGLNITDSLFRISKSDYLDDQDISTILSLLNAKIPYGIHSMSYNHISSALNIKKQLKARFNGNIIDYLCNSVDTVHYKNRPLFISSFLKNRKISLWSSIWAPVESLKNQDVNAFILYWILYSYM